MEDVSGIVFGLGVLWKSFRSDNENGLVMQLRIAGVFTLILIILQRITSHHTAYTYRFRMNSTPGFWLLSILPVITVTHSPSIIYWEILCFGIICLLLQSELDLIFKVISGLMIMTILYYSNASLNIYHISVFCFMIFVFYAIQIMFHYTFTFGEAVFLCQLMLFFSLKTIYCLIAIIPLILLHIFTVVPTLLTVIKTLLFVLLSEAIMIVYLNHQHILFSYIFNQITSTNILLFHCWLVAFSFCILMIIYWKDTSLNNPTGIELGDQQKIQKDASVMRKAFHFLASAVFASGLCHSIPLINMASFSLLYLFLVFEFIRQKGIDPLSSLFHSVLLPFCDEKDRGDLVFTPIALLLGLSLPIWFYSVCQDQTKYSSVFMLWSGVITVGIGDSFASLIGNLYGYSKWPYSYRTIEGSLGAFLSMQFSMFYIAAIFKYPFNIYSISFTAGIITLIEAYTCQIDNMVLPACMMALL